MDAVTPLSVAAGGYTSLLGACFAQLDAAQLDALSTLSVAAGGSTTVVSSGGSAPQLFRLPFDPVGHRSARAARPPRFHTARAARAAAQAAAEAALAQVEGQVSEQSLV